MFTKKSNPVTMAKNVDLNSPDKLNRIVEGTIIEGEIKSSSNMRIDGRVTGSVSVEGRLVVGSTGYIKGDIVCQNGEIEGQLNGKISVINLLSLKTTAKLNGDIITSKLAIEPGALFTGSCSMGGVVKDIKTNDKHRLGQKEKTA